MSDTSPTTLNLYFVADSESSATNRDLLCWAVSPEYAIASWRAYYQTEDKPQDVFLVPTQNPKPGPISWHAPGGLQRAVRSSMNPWQRAVLRTYGGGDFAHFGNDPDWRRHLDLSGDTLFRFLMIELSTREDCKDAKTAFQRLANARADIDTAMAEVEPLITN